MNSNEIIRFAIVLIEAGEFDSAEDVGEFLKKPSRWIDEYNEWRSLDSPRPGDDGWDDFTDMMESRDEA